MILSRAAQVSTARCLSPSTLVTRTPVPGFRAFCHHSCQQQSGGQSAMRRKGRTHKTPTTVIQANSTALASSPPGPAKGKSRAGESNSRKYVVSFLSDVQFLNKTCLTGTPRRHSHSQQSDGRRSTHCVCGCPDMRLLKNVASARPTGPELRPRSFTALRIQHSSKDQPQIGTVDPRDLVYGHMRGHFLSDETPGPLVPVER